MACPFFIPTEPLAGDRWAVAPRMPLGDTFAGECCASGAAVRPDEDRVRKCCNAGYGRGSCPDFPADGKADAVRFSVVREADGVIGVRYVLEKEWRPFQFGDLEYHVGKRRFLSPAPENRPVAAQAAAFIANYIARSA